jgi:osmoprotectant transport system permease protein
VLLDALRAHVALAATALAVASAVALPLGVLAARSRGVATVAISTAAALRVVPSLAVLALVLPYLGLGFRAALVALVLLAIPPLLLNTAAAYRGLDPAVLEAARGMGLSRAGRFVTIETPLALPVIVAGLRTAGVEVVASATLAAFIGAGGLGDFIVNGLAMADMRLLLMGAVPVALLALAVEAVLAASERLVRGMTA